MNFKELLYRARQGDEDAILEIFEMYADLEKTTLLYILTGIYIPVHIVWGNQNFF